MRSLAIWLWGHPVWRRILTSGFMTGGFLIALVSIFAPSLIQPPSWNEHSPITTVVCGVLIGSLSFLAGIIGNLAAERVSKSLESRLPPAKEFFANHHLTRLVGQSMGMIVLSVSERIGEAKEAQVLQHLAGTLRTDWEMIVQSPDSRARFAGILDRSLLAFVRDPRKPALDETAWNILLRVAGGERITTLSERTQRLLVNQLSHRFGEALRLALKRDYVQGGEAAMGLVLDISASLLNSAAECRQSKRVDTQAALSSASESLQAGRLELNRARPQPSAYNKAVLKNVDQALIELQSQRLENRKLHFTTQQRLGWTVGGVVLLAVVMSLFTWQARVSINAIDAKLARFDQLYADWQHRKSLPRELVPHTDMPPELVELAELARDRGNAVQHIQADIVKSNFAEAEKNLRTYRGGAYADAFTFAILEGDLAFGQDDFTEAVVHYEVAHTLKPLEPRAREVLAGALFNSALTDGRGDVKLIRAVELLRANLGVVPAYSVEWAKIQKKIGLALATMSHSDLAEATTYFNLALDVFPSGTADWAETQFGMGWALLKGPSGDPQDAIDCFMRALEVYEPRSLEWACLQNNIAFASQRLPSPNLQDVIQRLQSVVVVYNEHNQESTSGWARAQFNLGNALSDLDPPDLAESVICLRRALEGFKPRTMDWASVQFMLGVTLERLSSADLPEAVTCYRHALEVYEPGTEQWAITQTLLGHALERLPTPDVSGAITCYKEALKTRQPGTKEWAGDNLLLALAHQRLPSPDLSEAITCYRRALDGYRQGSEGWAAAQLGLGDLLCQLPSPELAEAVVCYQRALQVCQPGTQAWADTQFKLATALGRLESPDLPEAINCYKRALEVVDPATEQWAAVQIGLGGALERLPIPSITEAITSYNAALQSYELNTEKWAGIQVLLGVAHQRLPSPDLSEAIECYRRALDGFPQGGEEWTIVQIGLGDLFCKLPSSDIVEAIACYDRAIESVAAGGNEWADMQHDVGYKLSQLTPPCIPEARNRYRLALQVYTPGTKKWAKANGNLGVSLLHEPSPDHAEAVDCFRQALEVYQAGTNEWALVQRHLGVALSNLPSAELSEARTCYERALTVYQPKTKEWAHVHVDMGDTLMRLSPPKIGEAIECYEQALVGYDGGTTDWANTQCKIGWALAQESPQKLYDAIACYEQALTGYEAGSPNWANIQYTIAVILVSQAAPMPVADVDQAVERCQLAIDASPAGSLAWGRYQYALADTYVRGRGLSDSEASGKAITCYKQALLVYQSDTPEWADIQNNIAYALASQAAPIPAGDLEEATERCIQAIKATKKGTALWAAYMHSLGVVFSKCEAPNRRDVLKKAIRCHQASLAVARSQAGTVQLRAEVQKDLATAYYHLAIVGESKESLKEAICNAKGAANVCQQESYLEQSQQVAELLEVILNLWLKRGGTEDEFRAIETAD